jgi:predicted dehydrogenase
LSSNRRKFIREAASAAAGIAGLSALPSEFAAAATRFSKPPATKNQESVTAVKARIKFSVIGINHGHINSQVETIINAGGEFVSFYAKEPDLAAEFSKRFPQAKLAANKDEILVDNSIQLVISAAIPDERAPLGIEVMKHGKDYMSDKPGFSSLEQLEQVRRVQKSTNRIYSILYSERLENKATVKAGELVKQGAIGRVIQTIGMGPHRMNPKTRPEWFFHKKRFGGIINDLASHQFDQFLFFTGSKNADVVASQVGNFNHPQYPDIDDFGDVMLKGDGGTGYLRVDWFTPDGLKSWGDARLTVLGTEGYMEIRKNLDIGGREGANHLFLVNQKETKYIDCNDTPLLYGRQLVDDILNRTETAMTQDHCFLAAELALKAEKQAQTIKVSKG